jgi:hypothetical protein
LTDLPDDSAGKTGKIKFKYNWWLHWRH